MATIFFLFPNSNINKDIHSLHALGLENLAPYTGRQLLLFERGFSPAHKRRGPDQRGAPYNNVNVGHYITIVWAYYDVPTKLEQVSSQSYFQEVSMLSGPRRSLMSGYLKQVDVRVSRTVDRSRGPCALRKLDVRVLTVN